MKRAPKSYLNCKRPPLDAAMRLESGGKKTIKEAVESLRRKAYFTPPPGPWQVGFADRGMGHYDYAVLDRFGDCVANVSNKETAELIVEAVNAHRKVAKKKKN